MKKKHDTIFAISTPSGTGAIAIIRLSGEKVQRILKNNLKKFNVKKRYVYTCNFYYNEHIVDKVNFAYFQGPKSYTGEDMLEIYCHGGIAIQKRILDILANEKLIPAKPGEFTLRALENGKMGLLEAEAINELIKTRSIRSIELLNKYLFGDFRKQWENLKRRIISIKGKLEASIDFSDEFEISDDLANEAKRDFQNIKIQISQWLSTFSLGKILTSGYHLAILGKPNTGKSSLLNTLLKEERAIVTDFEGTTRDILKEEINIKGYDVFLYDTAGIRDTENLIEKIGIEKVRSLLKDVNGVVILFDLSTKLDINDKKLLILAKQLKKDIIIFLNKSDIKQYNYKRYFEKELTIIEGSAKKKKGVEKLLNNIHELLEKKYESVDHLIFTKRQEMILKKVKSSLGKIIKLDFLSETDLAADRMNELFELFQEFTGEYISNATVQDYIFKNFCIGK
ncbi:tRNA uridine-5-carboxymethylaminomethyl(34) synthesis GTPase MnmE [bacterium]|nr:tRNA uridine-5-carboxymethylaminomethyl(34) synthesis GTPase MnmE [bacterium]